MPDLNHLLNRLTHLGDLDDSCSLDEQQEIEYGALVWDCTPQLAKALRAVLELHKPQWSGDIPPGGYICAACNIPVESEPCPTMQAIHDAIGDPDA